MENNMKQFNLQKYMANPNRQVVTRDGRKVRIICTDRAGMSTKPVVALITLPNGDENIKSYWANGIETAGCDGKDDLFFADEEAHKHEGWMNLYRAPENRLCGGCLYNSKDEAIAASYEVRGYIRTIKIEWED